MASHTSTVPNEKGDEEYTKLLRNQVDDVLLVMEDNVKKVQERGDKMQIGEETVLKMKEDAENFKKLAHETKKKYMWENYKMIVVVCLSIAAICLVAAIVMYYNTEEDTDESTTKIRKEVNYEDEK